MEMQTDPRAGTVAERDGPVTLILSRSDIARLLGWPRCIDAVERAFAEYNLGRTSLPAVGHLPASGGAFHIKAAAVAPGRPYVAVKLNGNFPANPARTGLPTIQGAVLLCDAGDGRLLAVLDSAELTARRTAAATAIAAKYLARRDARFVTLIGCGAQAPHQLRALCEVRRPSRVAAFDKNAKAAGRFARAMAQELGIDVAAVDDFAAAAAGSDIIVTCTSATQPFLRRQHVSAGAFVAAVGADAPDKQELEPELLGSSRVIVDVLDQCVAMGELHHALACAAMTRSDVHAELGEIICGLKPGRTSPSETFVFDSTGVAIQDVAAAAAAFEGAVEHSAGMVVELSR